MKKMIIVFVVMISCSLSQARTTIIHGGNKDLVDGMGIIGIEEIKVSSILIEKNKPKSTHSTDNLDDGKPGTSWVEGVKGSGIGEWIKIYFDKYHTAYRMIIINGFAKNKKLYYANNRVKKILIEFSNGKKKKVKLKDGVLKYQTVMLGKVYSKWMKITILEVYKGKKYDDTCIAEIHLDHWDED